MPPCKPPTRGGARKGAGRKPGSARQGKQRTWLISDEALAVLEAIPERQRGVWVTEAIIMRAARDAAP